PRRIHHPPLLPTPKELPQVIKLLSVCYRRSRAFISRRTGGARCEIVQVLPIEETRADSSALIDQPLRRYIRKELHVLLYCRLKGHIECGTKRYHKPIFEKRNRHIHIKITLVDAEVARALILEEVTIVNRTTEVDAHIICLQNLRELTVKFLVDLVEEQTRERSVCECTD